MKILVVDLLDYTGPYNRALCAGLIEQGHQVLLVGAGAGASAEQGETGVPYQKVEIDQKRLLGSTQGIRGRVLEYWKVLGRLGEVARAFGADVIHFQWTIFPLVERAFLLRLGGRYTVAHTVHDATLANGDRVSSTRRIGLHGLIRRFDVLFSHTAGGAAHLERCKGPRAIVRRIHHGLLPVASPLHTGQRSDDKLHILLFGKIKRYKGLDLLIEAAARLSPEALDLVVFDVVGKPDIDLVPLLDRAEQLGVRSAFRLQTEFVPDDQVGAIFAAADVVAFPYRAIEASGVLMIALNYAKPIVASDIGLFGELLPAEALVPVEDVTVLAQRLERIVTDDSFREAGGKQVAAVAAGIPTWREIARESADAYAAAIGR